MNSKANRHELVLAVCLVALLVTAAALDSRFLLPQTQLEFAGSLFELLFIAVPMTFIVMTGGIDLSVGGVFSLSAVAFGLGFERGWPLQVCAGACLAVGCLAGLLNGAVVTKARVHPLIVTLATMSASYGLAEGLSHARPISGFPPALTQAMSPLVAGGVSVALLAAAAYWGRSTVLGTAIGPIGHNEEAVRLSGVAVDKAKMLAYAACGTTAALAALSYMARRNTAKADIGSGLELVVVTAVVLGGTSIAGGRGSLIGTALGALLIHETRQFIGWHWERDEWVSIVLGALLILVVLAKNLTQRRDERAQ